LKYILFLFLNLLRINVLELMITIDQLILTFINEQISTSLHIIGVTIIVHKFYGSASILSLPSITSNFSVLTHFVFSTTR